MANSISDELKEAHDIQARADSEARKITEQALRCRRGFFRSSLLLLAKVMKWVSSQARQRKADILEGGDQ